MPSVSGGEKGLGEKERIEKLRKLTTEILQNTEEKPLEFSRGTAREKKFLESCPASDEKEIIKISQILGEKIKENPQVILQNAEQSFVS